MPQPWVYSSQSVREQRPEVSVKPFICRVEFGKYDDQNFHLSQGPMSGTWPYQHGHPGMHGKNLAIQLHPGVEATLQKEVGLREPLVVMKLCVLRNFRDVNRTGKIRYVRECAPGGTTRTRSARDLSEVDDFVSALLGDGHPEQLENGTRRKGRVGGGPSIRLWSLIRRDWPFQLRSRTARAGDRGKIAHKLGVILSRSHWIDHNGSGWQPTFPRVRDHRQIVEVFRNRKGRW